MELTLTQKIDVLIPYLPEKDIKLASKFYESHNWRDLIDLVDSSYKKVMDNLESNTPKSEYLKLDIEKFSELYACCIDLQQEIFPDDFYTNDDNNFEDYE